MDLQKCVSLDETVRNRIVLLNGRVRWDLSTLEDDLKDALIQQPSDLIELVLLSPSKSREV